MGRAVSHGKVSAAAGHANRRKSNSYAIRRPNAELRTREHLTPGEVETLIEAAKGNR